MDWFELEVTMPDDQKFENLGTHLNNPQAGWYVVKLYAYCYHHETDRFAGIGAVGMIERASGWRGKTGRLVTAYQQPDVAILDREGDVLIVHGVGRRLAAAIDRRTKAVERMRKLRGERSENPPGTEGTSSQNVRRTEGERDANVPRDPTGPDLTVPDRTDPTTFDRFCGALSQRLGFVGAGGYGLGRPQGRKLPDAIRIVLAAVKRVGFDAAVTSCVQYAGASGAKPEAIGFFMRHLSSLGTDAPRNGVAKPCVTAPASDPKAFEKGGRVAL